MCTNISALLFGAIVNSEIIKEKKHKIAKDTAPSRLQKDLFTVQKLQQGSRASPYSVSARNVLTKQMKLVASLCKSMNDCKSTVSAIWGLPLELNFIK